MDDDLSRVCFVGIYGHNQDDVLRESLADRGVTVTDVTVPRRSVAEAKADRRLPVRTMRATINWFGDVPAALFPVLFAGTLLVHTLLILARVPFALDDLRAADVLVVPHMGDTSVVAAKPLGVLFDAPVVYVSHNGIYYTMVRNRGLYPEGSVPARVLFHTDRLLHRLSDRVVVFSEESGDRFAATFGVPRDRYEVVYISVVESNFSTADVPACPRPCDVLYWGNFHPHHGPLSMVEAAALAPDREFVFLGQSAKRERVVAAAERLDLDNVSFPGFVDSETLVAHIKAADAVLGPVGDNPQTAFTIGTKVAEAAYLRKAILVGANPAPKEVFDHGESAHLVAPGDPEDLAAGVEAVCGDDDYRERLAAGGRGVYDRHFAPARAAERFLEIAASARASL